MARWITLKPIPHEKCRFGYMMNSTLEDDNGNPVMFAVVSETGAVNYNSIVFQGICSQCKQEFRLSYMLESMLIYKEV